MGCSYRSTQTPTAPKQTCLDKTNNIVLYNIKNVVAKPLVITIMLHSRLSRGMRVGKSALTMGWGH